MSVRVAAAVPLALAAVVLSGCSSSSEPATGPSTYTANLTKITVVDKKAVNAEFAVTASSGPGGNATCKITVKRGNGTELGSETFSMTVTSSSAQPSNGRVPVSNSKDAKLETSTISCQSV